MAPALTLLLIAAASLSVARATDDEPAWFGADARGKATVRLYFFWTETCPHCQKARPFVEGLAREFGWLDVHSLPISEHNPDNIALFLTMTEALGQTSPGVPAFAYCGRMTIGFGTAETTGAALRKALVICHDGLSASIPPAPTQPQAAPITVPLFGLIDPETVSLPLFTIVIASADAFNPCAFFVLMFLMSLLVHARQRWRMAVIGAIFVLTSGVLYFAFMAAWLNVFLLIGELKWVTTLAALFALALAAVNIKDYFWFRRGVSLGISQTAKPGLFARMRTLTVAESWPVLLLGAVTLAVAANTYELLCTAGFPMLFTRVLTMREMPDLAHYLYLALYNVVYVIPLLGIATVFLITFRSRKLQEHEGRTLKLLSGLMMLGLGLALLFSPDTLSDIRAATAIVLAAIAATAAIAYLDRRHVPS